MRDHDAAREELLVGKVGAQHQQQIAVMHRYIARGEADESSHADIVGVVVFDMLLAAERMDDGALQCFRELHQPRMRASAAAATKQRHALHPVQQTGKGLDLGICRRDDGNWRQQPCNSRDIARGRRFQRHIARDHDDGDTAFSDSGSDSILQQIGHLARVRDQLAIHAAFAEQVLRMGLLEISPTDLRRRNLRGDGEHGRAAALGIVEAIDEVKIARTAGAGADSETAGDLGFSSSRESCDFLMADMNPFDVAGLAQRLGQPVEAVADDTVNALDSRLTQSFDDQIGDVAF